MQQARRTTDNGGFLTKVKYGKEILYTALLIMSLCGILLAAWGDVRYVKQDSAGADSLVGRVTQCEQDTGLIKQEITYVNEKVTRIQSQLDRIEQLIMDSLRNDDR